MWHMKKCSICHISKPLSDFNRYSRSKDGRQAKCRACSKVHYENNKPAYLASTKSSNNKRMLVNKAIVNEHLKNHPCVDCGEDDHIVLEFDHVRGKKRLDVSNMMTYSTKSVIDEIAKCDVRCANCHRRVTHQRRISVSSQKDKAADF